MEKVTKSYVEKIYRGILFSEPSISEVEERDPMQVANALSHFAKNGDAYRVHWNKQYGVEDAEEKGTVNPAILSTKKK